MGDENSDPCECIWSHELYMRRLLNIIRNSQTTCTDSECFEDGFRNQSVQADQNLLLLSLFFVAALFLYYFRPRPQRSSDDTTKSNGDNRDGNPPNPPSTIS